VIQPYGVAAVIAAMVLIGPLAAPVLAQDAAAVPSATQLSPGQRVQVRSPRIVNWEQTGQLLAVDDTGLRIDHGGEEPLELAWNDIDQLRVERSTRGAYWEGGFIGLLIGVLVAEGIVGAERDDGEFDPSCGQAECFGVGFTVAVGVAGAAAGAAVGTLLFERTLWQDVPNPGGGGVSVAAGLAWTNSRPELRVVLTP
jgi:hypothetical protein